MKHWTMREHAAHVSARFWSAGWEFETAEQARDYVTEQFAKCSADDISHTPFRATVRSNGVSASVYCSRLSCDVRTATYRKGDTMRDLVTVASPTDCVWMVPGMNEDAVA
jgi:hypothetical protein